METAWLARQAKAGAEATSKTAELALEKSERERHAAKLAKRHAQKLLKAGPKLLAAKLPSCQADVLNSNLLFSLM